jgi:non-specific serine/threonine protein kinase/serine/threonine-protein kinase
MTPERWQQVKAGFIEAIELEGAEREAYLAASEERDPDLRRQIESLLLAHASPDAILNFDARHFLPADADIVLPDPWLGKRVGAYELLECIGRGGMGAVYRACRADTEYTREVAIKLVRAGFANDLVLQRLRTERQILADLDHPNIARLLDGGVTGDGEPFLVLELVHGEAIDKYCASRHLSVSARIALFREVCAAVAFAHRHLVVHRDLKPSNILVTDEGAIKLLDFGIAKLLQPSTEAEEEEDATRTLFRAMTPAFSSPEQILGLRVTTVSDVYSLGVVLFHLLCGVSPYRSTLSTHREALRAICEDEPRGAAEALRQSNEVGVASIDADLDSILSKALRKEPERRFSSVEQLSEDLRRYLEGMPVIARGDRLGYRLGKYWRRNKAILSAVMLVAIALIGGLFMTLREAHLADQQRDLAAQRFNDTRQLAHAFIFDVQDAVRGMPGAGPAREILVRTGLKYLDSLTSDASDDRSMLKELAESYVRMGDVQGEPQNQNKGEPQAAAASYAKALKLFERAGSGAPSPEVLAEMAQTRLKRGNIMMMLSGDPEAAAMEARKATDILELRLSTQPGNQDYLYDLVRAYAIYTQEASFAGDDAAVDFAANRSIALTDDNFQQHPGDARAASMLGTGYLIRLRPPHQPLTAAILEDRLSLCKKALSLDQRFVAKLNASPREINSLTVDFNNLGIWLGIAGRFKESAEAFAAAASLSQDQFDKDPHNGQWKLDNVRIHMNLDRARIRSDDFDTAQADLIRTMPAARELEKSSNSLEVQYFLATLEQELGTIEMHEAERATSRAEKVNRWHVAHELFAGSVTRFQPIATTAKLDLNDRPPVDWAAEGRERSEAELKLLAAKPAIPTLRKLNPN